MPPQLNIRHAVPDDAPLLARHISSMFHAMAAVGGRPVKDMDTLVRTLTPRIAGRLHGSHSLYLVGELDGVHVGSLEGTRLQTTSVYQAEMVLHIHAVFVEEAYRRNGIARQLMQVALKWGRDHDCTEAALRVLVNNPARNLYSAVGFKEFELEMTRRL